MPRRPRRTATGVLRFVLLALAGIALVATRGRRTEFQAVLDDAGDVAPPAPTPAPPPRPQRETPRRPGVRPRRVAASFAIAVCFSAGAALSAGAGDRAALMLEDVSGDAAAETSTDTAPVPEAAAADEPELVPLTQGSAATAVAEPDADPGPPPAPEPAPAEGAPDAEPAAPRLGEELESAPAPAPAAARSEPAVKGHARRALQRTTQPARPSLERASGVASGHTLWLVRPIVETPPALRLSPAFAERMRRAARRHDARWSVVFGVLRASGSESAKPATLRRLDSLAIELSGVRPEGDAISAALGRPAGSDFGERAAALARYARAVGLETLVQGLEASRKALGEHLLADPRVDLYPGGHEDVVADRIDPRVLALVAYLAETYGQVTVSSLTSGHRLYSRPGILSAHVFGQAVDVAALGGIPVLGNQEPGGLVEHAIRSILRLPSDLRPAQVISLLGLGGPSFPLADHADHIHVGF